MTDENESTINLLDYPPLAIKFHHWKGSGELRWRQSTWKGDFAFSRLLNGRLRFVFKLHNWRESSEEFVNQYPIEFEGTTEDSSLITVSGIHFTRRFESGHGNGLEWICIGYATTATMRIEAESDTISIRCDLSNYSLNQALGNVEIHLNGFDITIERLGWGKSDNGIEEHAIAYQYASLTTSLIIKDIPYNQVDNAMECLHQITGFLSIACRGHVAIVAQYMQNQSNVVFDSKFDEPAFLGRRWGRPLISPDHVEDFLQAVCQVEKDRVQQLELAFIADHYLHALTIRSIWPQSVGIFTAMETLKSVFFAGKADEENAQYFYWVVPPEDFASKEAMIAEIIDVLAKHFDRFSELTESERDSLKAKLKGDLNRRSYKTQLRQMLTQLNVDHTSKELRFFVNTRNSLIHQGTPVPAATPMDEYNEKNAIALQAVKNAVNLFERVLLAFLGYSGPCELYSEGWG